MAWYNPFSWDLSTDADRENAKRAGMLDQQAAAAAQFGQQAGQGFNAAGFPLTNAINNLTDIANGNNSIAQEQLRQNMQQNMAQQRSMAASANPTNSAGAARIAMNNLGRLNYGQSGAAALASLQERQAATNALGSLALGMRGQDLTGFLQGNANAMSGYGAQMGQSAGTQMMNAGIGGLASYLATKSDKRAKKNIAGGDKVANKATSKLTAHTFSYKDPARDGKGKQLGVMAQDLEKSGLKHAVIDTPHGKMVHGGKLATANTAMIAALGRRVEQLEKKRGRKAA